MAFLKTAPAFASAVTAALALGTAAIAAPPAIAQSAEPSSGAYPPEMAREYVARCAEAGIQQGLFDADQADVYCRCTLRELQSRFTPVELAQLAQQGEEALLSSPDMMEMATRCIQEVPGFALPAGQ